MESSRNTPLAKDETAASDFAPVRDRLLQLCGKLPDWLIDEAIALQAHPRFDEAIQVYAEIVLKNFRKLPFLARITSGEARYLLCTAIAAYQYTQTPDVLETRATISRLQALAVRFGIASPNRIVAMLSLMQFAGAVRTTRSQADRRVKLVEFADSALAYGDKIGKGTLQPLQLLATQHDYLKGWEGGASFRGRYYSECLRLYEQAPIVTAIPEYEVFATQDAAGELRFRFWLALSGCAPDAPPVVDLPFGQLARDFGVSRAHIRRLFERCQEIGLLKLHKPGGLETEFLPLFAEVLKAFTALEFALMKRAADFAAAEPGKPGSMAWLNG